MTPPQYAPLRCGVGGGQSPAGKSPTRCSQATVFTLVHARCLCCSAVLPDTNHTRHMRSSPHMREFCTRRAPAPSATSCGWFKRLEPAEFTDSSARTCVIVDTIEYENQVVVSQRSLRRYIQKR